MLLYSKKIHALFFNAWIFIVWDQLMEYNCYL